MALVSIKSINGNTNIPSNINKYNFLKNLSECSVWNVQTIAKNLKDANLSGTCVIVTKEITFYLNEKPTSVLNEEYMFMQKIIANGASACAPLGINFHITEKTKYEREYGFPYKKKRKLSVFTITLKNIDLTNIQAYAENYKVKCENQEIEQLRSMGSSFYMKVINSPITTNISNEFALKIKELSELKKHSNYQISISNRGISLCYYEDRLAGFSFSENGLVDLNDNHQRLGFVFAVIDKLLSLLKTSPVLCEYETTDEYVHITNKSRLVFNKSFSSETEQFELIFQIEKKKKTKKQWY